MNPCLFSSASDNWSTPQYLFDKLDKEFHFTLDPCASVFNHKCDKYFTLADNGLVQDWSNDVVFVNPPYGKVIYDWVRKAYNTSLISDKKIVLLLPSRTDTKWFHDFIYNKSEIRFIRGRLKFGDSKNFAPFPSMIVIYN